MMWQDFEWENKVTINTHLTYVLVSSLWMVYRVPLVAEGDSDLCFSPTGAVCP